MRPRRQRRRLVLVDAQVALEQARAPGLPRRGQPVAAVGPRALRRPVQAAAVGGPVGAADLARRVAAQATGGPVARDRVVVPLHAPVAGHYGRPWGLGPGRGRSRDDMEGRLMEPRAGRASGAVFRAPVPLMPRTQGRGPRPSGRPARGGTPDRPGPARPRRRVPGVGERTGGGAPTPAPRPRSGKTLNSERWSFKP